MEKLEQKILSKQKNVLREHEIVQKQVKMSFEEIMENDKPAYRMHKAASEEIKGGLESLKQAQQSKAKSSS